jgi:O-antigen/teichoic acid export membrane protein
MMLVVSMYDYAWRPFYFSIVKEQNAKEIFARVLTYLLLAMSGLALALTFFIDNIATVRIFGRHMIGPSYWSGLNIVPIVLFGYVFLGVAMNLSAGIYIEKKTKYLPVVTFIGACVNVIANLLLIPMIGMTGAAWATFLAYLAQAIGTYIVVQRIYPITYELGRLTKIVGAVVMVLALYYLIPVRELVPSPWIHAGWKLFLLVLFLSVMYSMRFFEMREVAALKRLVSRGRNEDPTPAEPSDLS